MSKRVAVVHDFCFQYGGGEKVVEKFLEMYPEADLYTSIFVPSKFRSSRIFTNHFESGKVKTTWLNGIFNWNNGFLLRYFKHFFWLYPLVMRSVTLQDYDLVLISSTDCGKQIRFNNSPKVLHYCHTPTRYLHSLVDSENYKIGFVQKFLLSIFVFLLRPMDLRAVEYLNSKKCIWIANSVFVQGLISEIYKTNSVVVYPPIEVEKFLELKRVGGSFSIDNEGILKQVQDDAVVEACNTPFEGVKPNVSGLLGFSRNNEGILSFVQDDSTFLDKEKNTPLKGSNEVRGSFSVDNEGILKQVQDDGVAEDVSEDKINDNKPFYLCHGRVSFHKRIDLAIRACLELGVRLKISGTSALPQEMEDLHKIIDEYESKFPAKKGLVELLGRTTEDQILDLISTCKAFIFPGKEDFGIAPVEMLAAGVPLIAYQSGGALEYVQESVNGVFFGTQTAQSITKAIQEFEKKQGWDEAKIRKSATPFDQKVFVKEILSLLN